MPDWMLPRLVPLQSSGAGGLPTILSTGERGKVYQVERPPLAPLHAETMGDAGTAVAVQAETLTDPVVDAMLCDEEIAYVDDDAALPDAAPSETAPASKRPCPRPT